MSAENTLGFGPGDGVSPVGQTHREAMLRRENKRLRDDKERLWQRCRERGDEIERLRSYAKDVVALRDAEIERLRAELAEERRGDTTLRELTAENERLRKDWYATQRAAVKWETEAERLREERQQAKDSATKWFAKAQEWADALKRIENPFEPNPHDIARAALKGGGE